MSNAEKVLNKAGVWIDFRAAVALMDDDICDDLHAEIAPCSDQDFFEAYEDAHEEKYGEEWELSKTNPIF